jgi:rare lipoprotein A
MQPSGNRHARKDDSRPVPHLRHPGRCLRAAAALAALAVLVFGASPAQAGPGGASPVASSTAGEGLVFTPFRSAGASWYGPGLYGNKTACGQTLRPDTLGVAHRNLPCGTAVKFVHDGHAVVTRVIDRGPFAKGRAWDLTAAVSEALEFDGVGRLRYAVAVSFARAGAQG